MPPTGGTGWNFYANLKLHMSVVSWGHTLARPLKKLIVNKSTYLSMLLIPSNKERKAHGVFFRSKSTKGYFDRKIKILWSSSLAKSIFSDYLSLGQGLCFWQYWWDKGQILLIPVHKTKFWYFCLQKAKIWKLLSKQHQVMWSSMLDLSSPGYRFRKNWSS